MTIDLAEIPPPRSLHRSELPSFGDRGRWCRQLTIQVSVVKPSDLVANNMFRDGGQLCTVKPGSVYDGDTLRVICDRSELKIRMCGIDAPEKDQPGGIEARDYLRSLLEPLSGVTTEDTDHAIHWDWRLTSVFNHPSYKIFQECLSIASKVSLCFLAVAGGLALITATPEPQKGGEMFFSGDVPFLSQRLSQIDRGETVEITTERLIIHDGGLISWSGENEGSALTSLSVESTRSELGIGETVTIEALCSLTPNSERRSDSIPVESVNSRPESQVEAQVCKPTIFFLRNHRTGR